MKSNIGLLFVVLGLGVAVVFLGLTNLNLMADIKSLRTENEFSEAKGRRQMLDYFADDRAFMGPLVITNDGVTISNFLIYYAPPTVEIEAAIHLSGVTSNVVSHVMVDMGDSASGSAFKFSIPEGSSLIGNVIKHSRILSND